MIPVRISTQSLDRPLPAYATKDSAGLDLRASCSGVVPARESLLVNTGLVFEIPKGFFGSLRSRSGLALKHGIEVGAGVIDSDYRGEVKVLLRNHSDRDFDFVDGDRIAQMIIQPYTKAQIHAFRGEIPELTPETERGTKGFGSSGVE